MLAAAAVFLIAFTSNVFYTVRSISDWVRYKDIRRDRSDLLVAIRTLAPKDAIFLAHPNRMAGDVRGFSGRGIVVAQKDQGASQLDATKFASWQAVYDRVKDLDFSKDVEPLKALARERGADYIILNADADVSKEDVVYRNATLVVIRP